MVTYLILVAFAIVLAIGLYHWFLFIEWKSNQRIFSGSKISYWEYVRMFPDVIEAVFAGLIAILISGFIMFLVCCWDKESLKLEHRNNPCEQCQYEKVTEIWYDKNHTEFQKDIYIWKRCPTLGK